MIYINLIRIKTGKVKTVTAIFYYAEDFIDRALNNIALGFYV